MDVDEHCERGLLSASPVGKTFDTAEEFEAWIGDTATTSPTLGDLKGPPTEPEVPETRASKIGRVLKDTLEAISPRSSTSPTAPPGSGGTATFELVPMGPHETVPTDQLLDLDGLHISSPRRREAMRLGITLEELDSAIGQVAQDSVPEEFDVKGGFKRAAMAISCVEDDKGQEQDEAGPSQEVIQDEMEEASPEDRRTQLFESCEAEFGLDDSEAEIWRGVWCDFDTDCDGMLSREELRAGVLDLSGQVLTEVQLDAAMGTREGELGNYMSYYDFLHFMLDEGNGAS